MKQLNEIDDSLLNDISGGTVNDNLTPGDLPNIDDIINDKNYERLADYLAALISRKDPNSSYNKRSREVNNNVDIYDYKL